MRAAWYERQGPAVEVLRVGDRELPSPARGEVRVKLRLSGVNPGDVKKRQGWLGSSMPFPLVIPHSDGAGTIDAVGQGVDQTRIGRRAWVFGAQSYRASGTCAGATVVPAWMAVDLPSEVPDELGASLGIPGITAHRAVFADGPVTGRTILVHGVRGAVGLLAAQLARWAGATVIGTVRHAGSEVPYVDHLISLDDSDDPARHIREVAPDGVDRIIEVDLASNAALDASVAAQGGVIAAYASSAEAPSIPFWPMLFANLTLRLLGSDDFPADAKRTAARDLTTAAAAGALSIPTAPAYPLTEVAAAHQAVESGSRQGRVLVAVR